VRTGNISLQFSRSFTESTGHNRNQTQKIDALIPETVEKEVAKAKTFLSEIDAILALRPLDKETSWLFGGSDPTVLDAHLAVFLMRLRDINRENLIPERLSRFADAAMATDEWRSVMGSRKTMMSKGQGT
jgi:glutathione S-transferase